MSAFRCAAVQGYDVIELDLDFTKDKKIVVLHDRLINRTARTKSGAEPKAHRLLPRPRKLRRATPPVRVTHSSAHFFTAFTETATIKQICTC